MATNEKHIDIPFRLVGTISFTLQVFSQLQSDMCIRMPEQYYKQDSRHWKHTRIDSTMSTSCHRGCWIGWHSMRWWRRVVDPKVVSWQLNWSATARGMKEWEAWRSWSGLLVLMSIFRKNILCCFHSSGQIIHCQSRSLEYRIYGRCCVATTSAVVAPTSRFLALFPFRSAILEPNLKHSILVHSVNWFSVHTNLSNPECLQGGVK